MWWQLAAFACGLWLMAAPALFGMADPAAGVLHVIGPIAAAIGFVAASSVTRGVRHANLLTGVALLVTPFVFGYGTLELLISLATGIALTGLSFPGGRPSTAFGGGWRSLFD
jgi:hypothetical protein